LLDAMPVRVILNDKTPLLGAARCAILEEAVNPDYDEEEERGPGRG